MKNFLRFFISKTFWFHAGIALVITILLAWITFMSLGSFTHHGEALAVPDFRGMTIDEVKNTIAEKKLRFEIIDSVYLTNKPRGTVVDQSPTPDFKVKENRKIFLTINAFLPERVKIPGIIGISLRQASANLETYGLKTGRLTYVPDYAKNVVLKCLYKGKLIKEGSLINKGESIDLVLGLGESNEKTSIPTLIGKTIDDATIILMDHSLNLGAIVCDETVKTTADSSIAKIWKQSPASYKDSEIKMGASIDIWITKNNVDAPADSASTDVKNDNDFDIQ